MLEMAHCSEIVQLKPYVQLHAADMAAFAT